MLWLLDWYHSWAIHPSGTAKLMWDWVIIVFVLYNAVLVPFQVAFQPPWATHRAFYVFDNLVDVMFWIDFVVNMSTGYVDKWGGLVTNKR